MSKVKSAIIMPRRKVTYTSILKEYKEHELALEQKSNARIT